MSGDEKKADRFADLGPPGLARRFSRDALAPTVAISEPRKLAEVAKPSSVEVAKKALAEAEAKVSRGRGRPTTVKPWEGICSKAEWYRRKKTDGVPEAKS